ncbi:cell wall assembly regulator SMI1 [Bacillus ectoiniformans]|uniref:SMI1/KNR4 family protein n=1 Tax=Bacillus ectoiniformans TaxID=1494429 RepID=UPI001EF96072|nr:SMI1/KNR4 family protein [Bacillus ectoiniformans]MBM7648082.1 cell wall assembly regulator SMI1 [Bacillus ectoiniformans]
MKAGYTVQYLEYDAEGQIEKQSVFAENDFLPLGYTYYADGDIKTYSDGTNIHAYTYNFAGRLDTLKKGSTIIRYLYDKSGNLKNPNNHNLNFNAANEVIGYEYDDDADNKELVFVYSKFITKGCCKLKKLWKQFEDWLRLNCPDALDTLNPGASESEISKVEEEISLIFPQGLKELLSIHNGQKDEGIGVLGNYYLLSLEEILETWKTMSQLLEKGSFSDFEAVEPVGPVKKDYWWNPKWISIATNGFGDDICLDLDPDTGGNTGQIITFWHDWEERRVISKSLEEWFMDILSKLDEGTYKIIEEDGEEMFNNDGFTRE